MALTLGTRSSLIARLPNICDQDAWREFVEIYEPYIYRQARRFGLQDADANEVVQDTLLAVSANVRTFEVNRDRGKFRTWLYAIGRNICLKRLEKLRVRERSVDEAGQKFDLEESSEQESQELQTALRRRVFLWAAGQVRGEFESSTWNAFWATAVENHSIKHCAESLSMSVGAVYIARSRVMTRLRSRVEEIVIEDFDHDLDGTPLESHLQNDVSLPSDEFAPDRMPK